VQSGRSSAVCKNGEEEEGDECFKQEKSSFCSFESQVKQRRQRGRERGKREINRG
jgi:hypothetical protein